MKPVSYSDSCSHLRPSISTKQRGELVKEAVEVLRNSGLQIDLLVVTGVSGTIFGTSLADAMGLPLAIVRKEEKPVAHSGRTVEGPDRCEPVKNWVFVDDLISSGSTYRRVLKAMDDRYYDFVKHVGIFLYCDACRYGCDAAKVNVPVFTKDGPFDYTPGWDNPIFSPKTEQPAATEVDNNL